MKSSRLAAVGLLCFASCSSEPRQFKDQGVTIDQPTAKIHEVRPGESIQAALDAAKPGEVIHLHPGKYQATQAGEAMLVFRAAMNGILVKGIGKGPEEVVIDGAGKVLHVIYMETGVDRSLVLENLTVTGGNAAPATVLPPGFQSALHPELNPDSDFFLDGGGLMLYRAAPTLRRLRIIDNRAQQCGAGITAYCPDGENCPSPGLLMESCELARNIAVDETGGGLDVYFGSQAEVRNCLFLDNAGWGSAIAVMAGGKLVLETSTLAGSKRQGVAVTQGGTASLSNSIFVGSGEEGYLAEPGSTVTARNNLFWQNSTDWTPPLDNGNLPVDPYFVEGRRGAYYLSQKAAGQLLDSPAVDAGNQTATEARVDRLTTRTDGAPDSGKLDLGFHYPP